VRHTQVLRQVQRGEGVAVLLLLLLLQLRRRHRWWLRAADLR